MKTLIIILALILLAGCSTLPNKQFKKLETGMSEHEVMLTIGRPHIRLAVGGMPTYMWCEKGMFGSTYWALQFTAAGRKLSSSSREILTHPGACEGDKKQKELQFRLWGEWIERQTVRDTDDVERMLERWY